MSSSDISEQKSKIWKGKDSKDIGRKLSDEDKEWTVSGFSLREGERQGSQSPESLRLPSNDLLPPWVSVSASVT